MVSAAILFFRQYLKMLKADRVSVLCVVMKGVLGIVINQKTNYIPKFQLRAQISKWLPDYNIMLNTTWFQQKHLPAGFNN